MDFKNESKEKVFLALQWLAQMCPVNSKLSEIKKEGYWVSLQNYNVDNVLHLIKYWPEYNAKYPALCELVEKLKGREQKKVGRSISPQEQLFIDECEREYNKLCVSYNAQMIDTQYFYNRKLHIQRIIASIGLDSVYERPLSD